MFTFGLCETRDQKTNKVVGYSMPFVSYDTKEGMKPEDEEFITMIETLTNTIRQKVGMKEVMGELKKKRSRKVDVDALSIMKTRMDKPDAPPVVFVKLRTEYGTDPPKVTTPFFKKATKIEKAKNGKDVVRVKTPLDYLKKKCTIIGGIAIESIFVSGIVESIITKLTEAVIVKKLDTQSSIKHDLEFGVESEEEEDEIEHVPRKPVVNEDEEEEEDTETLVKLRNPRS